MDVRPCYNTISERSVCRNASQRGQGCHKAVFHLEEKNFFNKIWQKEVREINCFRRNMKIILFGQ